MRYVLALVIGSLVAGACGGAAADGYDGSLGNDVTGLAEASDAAPESAAADGRGAERCRTDDDCANGVYCDGIERCLPNLPGYDGRGCVLGPLPCLAGQACDGARRACASACDRDGDADRDGHRALNCGGDDCDDADPNRYPGRAEVCDSANHDEDCDPTTFGFRDSDMDSHPDGRCCNVAPDGSRACGDDCNDYRPDMHPGLAEACDAQDNDCDGATDEDLLVLRYYPDCDGDLFGAVGVAGLPGCAPPVMRAPCAGATARWADNATDCDDRRVDVHPGATEQCNDRDDDCNPATLYAGDADRDGHDPIACGGGDCNDADPTTYRGAPELCDRRDNDCTSGGGVEVAEDRDGDGHASRTAACSGGPLPRDDCDDTRFTLDECGPCGVRCGTGEACLRGVCRARPSCPDASERGCAAVTLPAGSFVAGGDPQTVLGRMSPGAVTVSSFDMDATEVTLARFRRWWNSREFSTTAVATIAYPSRPLSVGGSFATPADGLRGTWTARPEGREAQPINFINWFTAQGFCAWDGGRLPTEMEWEYAARGVRDGRPVPRSFPWGDTWRSPGCDMAQWNGCAGEDWTFTRRVGSFAATGGLFDLAGNLLEWTADSYEEYGASMGCWSALSRIDPLCVTGTLPRSMRGGAWNDSSAAARSAARRGVDANQRDAAYGFRCVRSR